MTQSHIQRNDASRERLAALIARLGDAALAQEVEDGWTVGATLAHLAFWDRAVAVRWQTRAQGGVFEEITPGVIDVVNAANLPIWRAVPGKVAAELALHAAAEVDALLRGLSAEDVAYALSLDRPYMIDRSGHRAAHLDQIEAILGR